jgi:hypothetical protein
MILDDNNKFLFIHIPKTGGSTIKNSLVYEKSNNQYTSLRQVIQINQPKKLIKIDDEDRIINSHNSIYQISRSVRIDNYFKFAFVRNPWDRIVSYYHYLIQYWDLSKDHPLTFRDWVLNSQSKEEHSFLDHHNARMTQFNYVSNPKTKELLLDFIGRFENLQEDFDKVCKIIDIPSQKLIPINTSRHEHYTKYYNEDTKNIIGDYYRKDVEYFGYEFGK